MSDSESLQTNLPDESENTPNTDHSVFPRIVRLTLQILPNHTRTLKFPHNARILVGRADDAETANDLMLELSNYGGEGSGVSRTHAAIHDQDGMVYITDLQSTNGTRINGLLLNANQPYRLREGDVFRLGAQGCDLKFREVHAQTQQVNWNQTLSFDPESCPILHLDKDQLEREVAQIETDQYFQNLSHSLRKLRRARGST